MTLVKTKHLAFPVKFSHAFPRHLLHKFIPRINQGHLYIG